MSQRTFKRVKRAIEKQYEKKLDEATAAEMLGRILRPKPKWVPLRVWAWLITKVTRIEIE